MTEAASSSKTSVQIYQVRRRHVTNYWQCYRSGGKLPPPHCGDPSSSQTNPHGLCWIRCHSDRFLASHYISINPPYSFLLPPALKTLKKKIKFVPNFCIGKCHFKWYFENTVQNTSAVLEIHVTSNEATCQRVEI
jgi:hypothetical protein